MSKEKKKIHTMGQRCWQKVPSHDSTRSDDLRGQLDQRFLKEKATDKEKLRGKKADAYVRKKVGSK